MSRNRTGLWQRISQKSRDMNDNIRHLIRRLRRYNRFLVLASFSLLSVFAAYQIIVRFLFRDFMSTASVEGAGNDWSLLEGYASLIALAILIGGLIFAATEYLRQESQISFQIYESIHARMTDPIEEGARRWIIQNIEPRDPNMTKEKWYEKTARKIHKRPKDWEETLSPGHQSIKRALNTLDYLGFIAENYVNVKGPLQEWMSAPIAKIWERIEPYVEMEREARGEPDFYRSASYLGEKCVEWRKKHALKSNIIDSAI